MTGPCSVSRRVSSLSLLSPHAALGEGWQPLTSVCYLSGVAQVVLNCAEILTEKSTL